MGSPIEIKKDGKKLFCLNQNETKQIELNDKHCTLQANFFLLKSTPLTVNDNGQTIDLVVMMNPMLMLIYVILFVGMFLIPLLHLNILGILILLVLYFVFLFSMLNKAYIIKEKM
ncbi:hypothetical protein RV12_GL002652 [Enterococcus quebecensis]|nr:hypothetical protein RV12_GL002652 [Enterococcus quebecensis]